MFFFFNNNNKNDVFIPFAPRNMAASLLPSGAFEANSFEEILAKAQVRAAKRRAQERQKKEHIMFLGFRAGAGDLFCFYCFFLFVVLFLFKLLFIFFSIVFLCLESVTCYWWDMIGSRLHKGEPHVSIPHAFTHESQRGIVRPALKSRQLPFLDLTLTHRHTIKGHGTFMAVVEHVHGREEEWRGCLECFWVLGYPW